MAVELQLTGFDSLVEIGQGASGTVYRARQIDLDSTVAIKVLDRAFDDRSRTRFERECRALGALRDHDGIVPVYLSGSTPRGRPYIVMAFAPGGSLADRIEGSGPLAWGDAAELGAQIGQALAAADEAGILHRDVKPENILFNRTERPMLADFGIAQLADTTKTRTGIVTASVADAAPEILDGKAPSQASDVYSLASTVYAAIAGSAPFVRGDDESLISVIVRSATTDPPDLRPRGVPEQLWAILVRGLAKDPAQRPSASEFAQDLRTTAGNPEAVVGQRPAQVNPTNRLVIPAASPERDQTPVRPVTSTDERRRWRRAVHDLPGWAKVIVPIVAVALIAAVAVLALNPFSTSTNDRSTLSPATAPPVVDECTHPLFIAVDGSVAPLNCGNKLNATAWQNLAAKGTPLVMTLGPHATPDQVGAAMCSDFKSNPNMNSSLELNAYDLSARYYGWDFALSPKQVFLENGCS